MTALEFMNRAYKIKACIRLKEEQLADIRSHANHITANYGTQQVSHSRNVTTLEDEVIRILDHEKSLERKIAELCTICDETYEVINLIADQTCRILLESRYVNGDTWEKTGAACGLSVRQAQRKKHYALRMVETVLKTKEANKNA